MRIITSVLAILLMVSAYARAQTDIPTDWIDPDTGHRIIRLSREDGSQSSYFHQNEFTPDGRKLIFMTRSEKTSPGGQNSSCMTAPPMPMARFISAMPSIKF